MSNDKLNSDEKQELQRQKWREKKKKQREKKKPKVNDKLIDVWIFLVMSGCVEKRC